LSVMGHQQKLNSAVLPTALPSEADLRFYEGAI
jgi:hypothetical protein